MRNMLVAVVCIWALSVVRPEAAALTAQERQRLMAHLEMTSAWLVDEVSGLSEAQLNFRRAPETWTILEVIDHLVVVGPIYWQDLQNALKTPAGGKTPSSDADILWYGIDRTNREKAIPSEVPKGVGDIRTALEAYRKTHERLLQSIRTTNDDLRGHIVARQRCNAYQWTLLISTHEQRHVLQIREMKADPKFPKSALVP
jgi:hypothetical protein